MDDIESLYGSFSLPLPSGGFLNIHPEMALSRSGLSPTGKYFVYFLSLKHGSCHFIAEQDENGNWFSEFKPPFISEEFMQVVGDYIEHHQG